MTRRYIRTASIVAVLAAVPALAAAQAPARPIIASSFNQSGPGWSFDFTVCNVDTAAVYSGSLSPGIPGMTIYSGNPPEDYAAGSFNASGSALSPPCPTTGVQNFGGLKMRGPIALARPAPCQPSITYTLSVSARKNNQQVISQPTTFTVTPAGPCPPAPSGPPAPPSGRPPRPPL